MLIILIFNKVNLLVDASTLTTATNSQKKWIRLMILTSFNNENKNQ